MAAGKPASDQPARNGNVPGGLTSEDGAFFGRRKSKKLRGGQAGHIASLLPELTLPPHLPADLASLFDQPVREVRLEIGFGGGEHLLAAARAEPDVGFIGVEPFINGMAKLVAVVARENLTNIRLWADDAAPLLERMPPASLARIDLFYPDPWPKRRQRKRRFVSARTLSAIAAALQPGACFRFASDIDDYVGWTLARLAAQDALVWTAETGADWTTPHDGWIETRYGLVRPEFVALYAVGLRDGVAAKNIVASSGLPKNTLSRSIQKLLQRRLLRRETDHDDLRSFVLYLTAPGRAICEETMPLMIQQQTAMLSALSDAEQRQLCELMDKLVIASPTWPHDLEKEGTAP